MTKKILKLKRKTSSKKCFILPVLAFLVFLLTRVAVHFRSLVENWYSQKLYVIIAKVLSAFSSLFPFSLDDLFYIFLIWVLILLLVLPFLKRISFGKALKAILNVLAVVYILFYVLWGFNYSRPDLNARLGIEKQKPDVNLFTQELISLIDSTNADYYPFNDFDKKQIDSLVEASYQKISPILKINYPQGKRRPKNITFSRFFAAAGISGYYGPFFNEIQVNKFVLPVEYPFVLAHEKAHQFGITSEGEANFYAWLVCASSPSKQLQYSANLQVLRFFLYQGSGLESYPKMVKKLDEKVIADYQKIRENWEKLQNEKVDKIASKVNDTYLKTNHVKKGIDDYNEVVQMVMDFSYDANIQQKYDSTVH